MSASDPLGFFYLESEGQITKMDSLGGILYTFSDPVLGDVTWIDASDPFRILLYYRSFNQLLFLDRTLSTIGDPVLLDELEIFVPAGMCRSSQGGFWVLEHSTGSLIQIDAELRQQVSIRFNGLTEVNSDSWFPMLEWKERLYICRKGRDIIQLDLYGTQLKNIPAKAQGINTLDDMLLFAGDQVIYQYHDFPGILSEDKMNRLPVWEQLNVSKNRALIKGKSGWQLFRLKKTPGGT